MLHLKLFGHFRATINGEPLSFPTKSVSALVAYLILEQRVPQPRAHLSTLLWPDSPDEQGRRNLRQTLLRLRQTVPDTADGQPPILTVHDTLQWNPAYPVEVDVRQFETEMAKVDAFSHTPLAETPYPALAPFQTALALYPADLLLGFDLLNDFYTEWLQNWRTKSHRQALNGLARLAECYGRAGQPRLMEKMARRQLALAPDHEEAHRQLMQAFLAQGEYMVALTHYATYEQALQEYDLQPAPALQELRHLATAFRLGRATPAQPIPHNLPPEETPFYGRQKELDDLQAWLGSPDQRLLTLMGLGGVGKTRLALTAARHFTQPWPTLSPRFPGGVWFVSLADVENNDEEATTQAIVESCGWQAKPDEMGLATVIRHLHGPACLLILDNLEHLPGMADLILQLLTALPTLTVLATSRHRLGLQREVVRHLHGLPTPQHESDTDAPSVALLTERMQRINSDFRPTPALVPALTRICRTLEGWPLALELTASWAERLPVAEIADHIAANLTSLQTTMPDLPRRHRSIEAVLAGSYGLLTPAQQQILARFAILRGGCTAEAAEKFLIASAEDMALLARRALFQQHNGRYAIHELIRQFALHKLEEMAEKTAAERAHAEYYLHLLISLERDLHGLHPLTAIRQLRPDRENLYKAWHWAVENNQYETLTATLPSLLRFYNLTGLLREGDALFRETRAAVTQLPIAHDLLLAHAKILLRLGENETVRTLLETLPSLENLSPSHQLNAHLHWGILSILQGFIPESRQHNQHALDLARPLGHQEGMINCLTQLGILHTYDGRHDAEIAAALESTDDLFLQRTVYSYLGAASIHHSRYREACAHWQKVLTISGELEDWYAVATFHNNLGDALRELGEFKQAEQAFQQALDLAQSLHHTSLRNSVLEGKARLHVLRGEYAQAISLAQEAVDLSSAQGSQYGEIAALSCLGHGYVGLALWEQAETAYTRAAGMLPDFPHLALESLAGLAYVRWRQGDKTGAREYINRFLDLLAHTRIEGFASPSLSYGRAAEVLRGLGEAQQAEAVLARSIEAR